MSSTYSEIMKNVKKLILRLKGAPGGSHQKKLRKKKSSGQVRMDSGSVTLILGSKLGIVSWGQGNFQDKIHMSLHVWCGAKNNPTHLSDLWRAELIFEPNLANGAEEENTEAREETLQ